MGDAITQDYDSYLKWAKHFIVKNTDMNAEMREEAVDICITAVEKYPSDIEKCTQVGGWGWGWGLGSGRTGQPWVPLHAAPPWPGRRHATAVWSGCATHARPPWLQLCQGSTQLHVWGCGTLPALLCRAVVDADD